MKICTAAPGQPLNSDVNVLILMLLVRSHGDALYGGCKSRNLQSGFTGVLFFFFSLNVKNILAFHLRTALRDTELSETGEAEEPCWRPP